MSTQTRTGGGERSHSPPPASSTLRLLSAVLAVVEKASICVAPQS